MTLEPGSRLGPYEILSPIGRGGMGEVFRARDTRLGRDVALKALPPAFARDHDRVARFRREAQVLASLNHPSIAAIYGLEEAGDVVGLALELVEGEDLAQRLQRGPIPVDETIAIARQIAEGLEEAHERGIVHRDLKPANIKMTPSGKVKILDFGLAKALETRPSGADASGAGAISDSPTVSHMSTAGGLILGTAPYMSPEQARGKALDGRTDIWSFGVVVFEMLTGRRLFKGETVSDVLAAVLTLSPDWSSLPAGTPPRLLHLIERCLDRDVKRRLQAIGEARIALDPAASSGPAVASSAGQPGPSASPSSSPSKFLAGLAAAFIAGALLVGGAFLARGRGGSGNASDLPVRASLKLPPDTAIAFGRGSSVTISPDGKQIAYTAKAAGKTLLHLRPLESFKSQAIAGTDGASNPFFSADGKWIGFFAEGKLKKVALDGGAPVAVVDARNARGEAWGPDDRIYFTPSNSSGVKAVSALDPKDVKEVTKVDEGDLSHRWPRVLPDNKALLYTIWNDAGWEPSRLAVWPLNGGPPTVVVRGGGYGRYVRDGDSRHGYLVYARSEGLLAAPFDEATLTVTGQAVPVLDGVVTNLSGGAQFDISASGTLVYLPGLSSDAARDLVFVGMNGQAEPPLPGKNGGRFWALSRDGKRLARVVVGETGRDIAIDTLGTNATARLTSGEQSYAPVWSRDGAWVAMARSNLASLARRRTDPPSTDELLTPGITGVQPVDFSPDGKSLLYVDFRSGSVDLGVLTLPAQGATTAPEMRPFVKTKFNETEGEFSPDGRFVAYQTNETGRFEICVRPFPGGEPKTQISTNGGYSPRWSRDGTEIYYRDNEGWMTATSVGTAGAVVPGSSRRLFDASGYELDFNVAPDGKRFLMMPLTRAEGSAVEVNLVLNFIAELRRRVAR